MKKVIAGTIIGLLSLVVAGCDTYREDRDLTGAAVGGAAGALIGGATTGHVGGALVGGALGAAVGAGIADSTAPRRCVWVEYDYYGNPYCRRWAAY